MSSEAKQLTSDIEIVKKILSKTGDQHFYGSKVSDKTMSDSMGPFNADSSVMTDSNVLGQIEMKDSIDEVAHSQTS